MRTDEWFASGWSIYHECGKSHGSGMIDVKVPGKRVISILAPPQTRSMFVSQRRLVEMTGLSGRCNTLRSSVCEPGFKDASQNVLEQISERLFTTFENYHRIG